MNTLYNTSIIETDGVRTFAGGGTSASTLAGALTSLFSPLNIAANVNSLTVGVSGAGTVNALTVNALGVSKFAYLTANGANIGPSIANFGLPTISLLGNAVYELVYDVTYTKNTAGAVSYTLSGSTTFTAVNGSYVQTPLAGITASPAAAALTCATTPVTTAMVTIPNTGSLAVANHKARITYLIRTNATANNVYLAVSSSAGTITPGLNSYYTLTRIA
jgi:hypothetical protein